MPFCVSSFAALIKDRGFVLIFDPDWVANVGAIALCAAFILGVQITKRLCR
jgi:aspartate/methionine/tyrosine aminotransferase